MSESEREYTREELALINRRLANKIISLGDEFQHTLRHEVKKARAEAWEEGLNTGIGYQMAISTLGASDAPEPENPYKE